MWSSICEERISSSVALRMYPVSALFKKIARYSYPSQILSLFTHLSELGLVASHYGRVLVLLVFRVLGTRLP